MSGNPDDSDSQGGGAKRRFFSGASLQQALVQAANHFHLDPEEIAYQALDKRHGFLKAGRKVVIEVDPEAPRRPEPPPRPQVAPPPPPAPAARERTSGEDGERPARRADAERAPERRRAAPRAER